MWRPTAAQGRDKPLPGLNQRRYPGYATGLTLLDGSRAAEGLRSPTNLLTGQALYRLSYGGKGDRWIPVN
jgi:hypothetical protein